jgi:hypothetical protein
MTESMNWLGKPGYRQKENLKMDLEIGWEYSSWIHLTPARSSDRLLFTWLWNLHKLWRFLTNWETLSLWGRSLLHEVSFVHIMTVVPPYPFMSAHLFVSSLLSVFFLRVECFITIQVRHMNFNLICSVREGQKIYRNFLFVLADLLCIVFSK